MHPQRPFRCGQQAALALADKIGERTVRCAERDIDRYQRAVAVCYIGNEELDGWLVKEGWALAFRKYSLDYVSAEDEAWAASISCRTTIRSATAPSASG
jgi:endonuclease YncB( thermonuclease family)